MKNIFVGTLPGIVLLLFAVLFGKGTYIHIYIYFKKFQGTLGMIVLYLKNPKLCQQKCFSSKKDFREPLPTDIVT